MKKIVLDCDLMRFRNTGLYYYCLNLGKAVGQLLGENENAAINFYVPEAEEHAFGSPAHTIVERKRWVDRFRRKPWHDCDVWHAAFQSGRIVPDRTRDRRTKVVLTIHDLNALHEGKSAEEQRRSIAHTQTLIDRSDAIVCISEFTKKDVLAHCETLDKPVYVIHNGVNRLNMPFLSSTSYAPRRPFLYGMGYINRKKNYEKLLPLLEKNEEVELVLAGHHDEPDYVDNMIRQARELDIEDRLKLAGPVSENEKAWYLENCMAFVHPSLAEGFGAPVVEAMTFGKPVFLSNLTALPEIAGADAFYFSSFEARHMQQIFFEGMKEYNRNGMRERIRKRAMHFNWQRSAREYLTVYESLF